ncbi:MAG: CoA ester lyase [Pseudonocardiaceae bacterium]|nr:CoA ester lyase [Pseudonocardiaceae bacterium]
MTGDTRPPAPQLPVVTSLYAPASAPALLPKALSAGADVVLVDLEDAVLADAKNTARANVLAFLDTLTGTGTGTEPGTAIQPGTGTDTGFAETGPGVQVRVNHPRGAVGPRDLAALGAHRAVREGWIGLRLPKVTGPDDVDLALELLGVAEPPPVHCLLESAAGVENANRIAEHPAVAGISLGEADLAAELGLHGEEAFDWIRGRVVVAAAAAGLPPPAMAVYLDLADPDGLAASCVRGRALGMFGRSALHPRQLPVITRAFTPSPAELERAREVVTAAAGAETDGAGAIALPDGRFVDAPIVRSAHRTIRLAEQLGRPR